MTNYYEQEHEYQDDDYLSPVAPVSEKDAILMTCPFSIDSGSPIKCLIDECMSWQKTESVNDNTGICLRLSF